MKILLLALSLVAATSLSVSAQDAEKTVTAQAINKSEVPASVLSGYQRDFPGGPAINDWKLIPKAAYRDHYAMNEEDDGELSKVDPIFYTVNLSGKGINAQAVYNQDGKLLQYIERAKNVGLPTAVSKAFAAKYPGARIVGDSEKVKRSPKADDSVYRVRFINTDKKHGYAIIDAAGNILKEHSK